MVLPENNKLNINALQRIFENANESYVFFWFKALLKIVKEGEESCSFNRVVSIMVTEAWPLILQKNLSLGNTDALERLILRIVSISRLNGNTNREQVYQYVYSSKDVYVKSYKKTVTRVIPYRSQQPFLGGFTAQDWNMKRGKLIKKINSREGLIYYMGNPDELKTKIIIADEWRDYLSDNYELLQQWADLEFLKYVQIYNPGDTNWFLNEKYTLEKKISDKIANYDILKDNRNYKLDIKMNHWTLDTIVQKSNFVFELHNNTSEDQKFYLDSCSIMHQNIENSMLSRETLNVFDINACSQSFAKICFESLGFDKFANKDVLKINMTELNGEKYMFAYRYNEATNSWKLYEYIVPELDYYDNIQIKNYNSEIFNSGVIRVFLKKINAVMSYKKGYQVQFRVINRTGKSYKLYITNRVDESAKIRNSYNLELLIDGNRTDRTKFIHVPYKLVSDSHKALTTGEPIRQTRFCIAIKVGNELIRGDKEICFDWLTNQVSIQSLEKPETKTAKITGRDFIIRKNKFYCEKKHNIKTVRAIVSIINKDGYITEKERPAAYCEKCKQYFILEKDYKRIKNDGTILCKIFETQQDAYNFFDERSYTFDWKSESSLKAMGYNVNAKSALTEAQRQGILAYAVDSGVYTVFQLCDFLGWLINSNYNKDTMHNAVAKWQSDRDFISKYRAGDYEKYFAKSITARRY